MLTQLTLGDIPVKIVRKKCKHIHLKIVPPTHEVRISVPHHMPIETAQALAMTKYDWLANRLEELRLEELARENAPPDEKTCLVWGKRLRLAFIEENAVPRVELTADVLNVYVRPAMPREKRDALLDQWYRTELGRGLAPMIAKWETAMNTSIGRISFQRMSTRWGTCNSATRTIRINTELAKKPPEHLEYILVHEMTHFWHNNHGDDFQNAMDHHLPSWRTLRRDLDIFPRS